MLRITSRHLFFLLFVLIGVLVPAASAPAAETTTADPAALVLPMERTAYFVGERVPMGLAAAGPVRLEAVGRNGRVLLYQGQAGALMLETAKLAADDYRLELNGRVVLPRLTLTSTLRRSAASIQDEAVPGEPKYEPRRKYTPQERAEVAAKHWDGVAKTLAESGVSAVFQLGSADTRLHPGLDTLARTGTIMLANPDTRPTSFNPTRNAPAELDSMCQRLILAAQANGRYPNFGGFCYGWDTCGFSLGGRKGLMIYWGWGNNEQPLRRYLERIDAEMVRIFTGRTGLAPVTEAEYVSYLLSIGRPEFATMIDLPTKTWLDAIARHTKPMDPGQRAAFERRLDAWSGYLMGMYGEIYGTFQQRLREFYPSLRGTASVQVDHAAVRYGQYFPSAYAPLDLQYQSTWNDQVGGPDYAYQWLYTQGLLEMDRGGRPTWISNAIAAAHGRAAYPGKFTRVAAHGLAHGASGIGFALEGFSNVLGGMAARQTGWDVIRAQSGGADVRAGRDFLERFACLAIQGHGDHGVGILFSRSQFQRQHVAMGFGQPNYKVFVALTRLGYTPRFVTEEELASRGLRDVKALVVLGQTFPLRPEARKAVEVFARSGGLLLVDGNTTIGLAGAKRFQADLPFNQAGKPHNWSVPNMPSGDNDTRQYARWHEKNAPLLADALGETGRGLLRSARGPATLVSLLQIDGGRDAKYVVAVNDSHVASQADWRQVREKLLPGAGAAAVDMVYDLTEERLLGNPGPLDCDLTATTARVFGLLSRAVKAMDLSATQKVAAGKELVLAVRLVASDGKPIRAIVPLNLSILQPDGRLHDEFYRATDPDGRLVMAVPIPANVEAGSWSLVVRCQLDGSTATLPVAIEPSRTAGYASRITEPAVVRGAPAIEAMLQRGQKLVLPIFESPQAERLLPAAEKVKSVLASRGVEVEIRRNPAVSTYWLAYDPSDEQKAENARADRGESFGRIKRTTSNGNDWFAALSGWRFGKPVVLLDVAGAKDNPIVESLAGEAGADRPSGLLWPVAGPGFPGEGRAVIQGLPWAFAPRVNALVIQAADVQGLLAGAAALANLPKDLLSGPIEAARNALWQQRGVGVRAAPPHARGLTAEGLRTGRRPRPFAIQFPETRPPEAEEAATLVSQPAAPPAVAIPATFEPKQLVPFIYDGDRLIEASAVSFLVPDLRFSNAVQLTADVKQPGKTRIVVTGRFRYSDRQPQTAAQWEDILSLYARLVPHDRKPMEIEVLIGGRSAGKLLAGKSETREVELEMKPSHGAKEVEKVAEEVVTELTGEVDLPAGVQPILLVHRNIIDGKIERIGVGMNPTGQ